MSELEKALRLDPLFRNRFYSSTTINEAIITSWRHGIKTTGLEIMAVRTQMMPQLVEAECLSLSLRRGSEADESP